MIWGITLFWGNTFSLYFFYIMKAKSTQKQQSLGEVRVIAGLWRGRKLPVFNAEGLRPTTARVKETLVKPFDVVFIDPPFHHQLVPKVLALLAQNHWLSEQAILYVETEKDHPPLVLPEGWQMIKEKSAGMVTSRLIQLTPLKSE